VRSTSAVAGHDLACAVRQCSADKHLRRDSNSVYIYSATLGVITTRNTLCYIYGAIATHCIYSATLGVIRTRNILCYINGAIATHCIYSATFMVIAPILCSTKS
jgi:hypothetical protein